MLRSSCFGKLMMTRSYSLPRLESAVKIEKFMELDSTLLPELWSAHFSEKPGNIGLSMSSKLTNLIKSRLNQYPMFILPVSRLTGHEIVLLESVVGDNFAVKMTGLEEYKRLGPQAPIRASLSFFTELDECKGLTLVHGTFDSAQMNSTQAGALVQTFCAAYSRDELFQWIRDFQDRPNEFNFDKFYATFTTGQTM